MPSVPPKGGPPPPTGQSNYPALEAFIERASKEDVAALFSGLKQSLDELKGPRAEQAKKVRLALERTEELLVRLLDVRENLVQPPKPGSKKH